MDVRVDVKLEGLGKLKKILGQMAKQEARVGIFEEDGAQAGQDGVPAITKGLVHYFGTNKIPRRDWLKMPLQHESKRLVAKISKSAKQVLIAEKYGTDAVMVANKAYHGIGGLGKKIIKEAFKTDGFGNWKPLSPKTLRKKQGRGSILVDYGDLQNAINYKVKNIGNE